MKMIKRILLTLVLAAIVAPVGVGAVGTHSLDLERGSSQYASITDASQTGLDITGSLTLEAWIKVESSNNNMVLLWKGDDAGGSDRNENYVIDWGTGGAARFYYTAADNDWHINTLSSTLPTGVWTHIAVVYTFGTGSTLKWYVNGVDSTESWTYQDGSEATENNNDPFIIGSSWVSAAAGNYFDGLVDEVRVFDDIRTAAEVHADALAEAVSNANLQGEWVLDNDYTDDSGNSNDLTATNSPVFESTDLPRAARSLDFEKTNSEYVTVAPQSHTNAGTIEFWVNPEFDPDATSNENWMFGGTAGAARALLYKNGFANSYGLFLGGASMSDGDGSLLNLLDDTGDWVHVAIAWDSTQSGSDRVIVYKNGTEHEKIDADPAGAMPATLYLGSGNVGTNNLDGKLDEFRIWSDQRTASEISDNYQVTDPADTTGLVDYWKLDNTYINEVQGSNFLVDQTAPTFNTDVRPAAASGRRIIIPRN